MGDEDTKIPELLQEMNAIYESQSHFSNIIDASKILTNFSKSLTSIIKKPKRFGTELDTIIMHFENNMITISEIFSRFSRFLQEEYLNLKLCSQSFDLARKSMSNSFRYSIQSFLEAKKIFQRSEDNYSNNVNKKPEKTLCPSLNYTILNHCLNNNLSSLNNEQKNSEGIYKMFMAKQEIYQESEKIYHEKMNFLIESVKNSCKDAIHNTHQAYGRIKSLYEKGVINFYDEEKRIMLEEKSFINIKEMKNMYNNENKYFFQSPIKNSLRKSPNFSNFDSEVRYQFSDPRVQNKKTSLSKIIKKESELFVTFNDKSDKKGEKEEIIQDSELKESIKSSEYELNCRMKKNEGNLNESLDIIVNKSKGLVLKKSEEFSLKGKLRYSEEQT